MNKAIDEVRAQETREAAARGRLNKIKVVLTHSRWCLLKRVENLTAQITAAIRGLCSESDDRVPGVGGLPSIRVRCCAPVQWDSGRGVRPALLGQLRTSENHGWFTQ
jgi:hypothetical protein